MKKNVLVIMAMILGLTLLAGCGDNFSPPTPPGNYIRLSIYSLMIKENDELTPPYNVYFEIDVTGNPTIYAPSDDAWLVENNQPFPVNWSRDIFIPDSLDSYTIEIEMWENSEQGDSLIAGDFETYFLDEDDPYEEANGDNGYFIYSIESFN